MEIIYPKTASVKLPDRTVNIRYHDFEDGRWVVGRDVVSALGLVGTNAARRYASSNINGCCRKEMTDCGGCSAVPVLYWSKKAVEFFAARGDNLTCFNYGTVGRAILEQVFGETSKTKPATANGRRKKIREIKFRGETFDGEIVYGYYNREVDGTIGIIFPNQLEVEVKPDSVSQLIAVDKNGVEIYEGDKVTEGTTSYHATFLCYAGILSGRLFADETAD